MNFAPPTINSLSRVSQGKVRDNYAIDAQTLLMVASDRLSAFDVVMGQGIPGKGQVLTQLSLFWFDLLADVVPNHLTGRDPKSVVLPAEAQAVHGRSMVVQRLQPIMVEAVVRGYLAGSGWKDYQASGQVCGIALPAGLQLAQALPEPIFTPAAKAAVGEHDENISFDAMVQRIGAPLAEQIRAVSLELYSRANRYAAARGVIIADTKFEFGLNAQGELVLMDEVLTADSSRFWPTAGYAPGQSPPSYDKQFVRDYLETLDWPKTPPAPHLPQTVIEQTAARYHEALVHITGRSLEQWLEAPGARESV